MPRVTNNGCKMSITADKNVKIHISCELRYLTDRTVYCSLRRLTQAAVRPLSQTEVAPSAVVAALALHIGFAPTLAWDQPGCHVGPRVAQPALQRPGRVTVARCRDTNANHHTSFDRVKTRKKHISEIWFPHMMIKNRDKITMLIRYLCVRMDEIMKTKSCRSCV